MSPEIEDLFFLDLDSHPIVLRIGVKYEVIKTVLMWDPFASLKTVERRHLLREVASFSGESDKGLGDAIPKTGDRVEVILFKPSGKYYTTEQWEVPAGAIGPYDMGKSPSFHRIGGGSVLVTSAGWGYPHLLVGRAPDGITEGGSD